MSILCKGILPFYLLFLLKLDLQTCNLTLSSGEYLLCSLLYNHMILFFPQFYNITSNHNNDTQNTSTLFIYPGKYDDHVLIFFSPSVPSTKHTTYTNIISHHITLFKQLTRQVYTKTTQQKNDPQSNPHTNVFVWCMRRVVWMWCVFYDCYDDEDEMIFDNLIILFFWCSSHHHNHDQRELLFVVYFFCHFNYITILVKMHG